MATELIDDLLADEDRDIVKGEDDCGEGDGGERPKVFGDSAYGGGEFQKTLEDHDIDSGCKTQPLSPPAGAVFPKSRFKINLKRDTVTCPGKVTAPIRRHRDGGGIAYFGDACHALDPHRMGHPMRSTHRRARNPFVASALNPPHPVQIDMTGRCGDPQGRNRPWTHAPSKPARRPESHQLPR